MCDSFGVDINTRRHNMPDTEKGIKELQELIGAVLSLGSELKEQSEDGKISISELLADLPEAYKVIEEGKDINEIMAEIADLDEDEAKLVIVDLTTFVFQIIAIIKNLKG